MNGLLRDDEIEEFVLHCKRWALEEHPNDGRALASIFLETVLQELFCTFAGILVSIFDLVGIALVGADYRVNVIETILHIKNIGGAEKDEIVIIFEAESLNVGVCNQSILIRSFALRVADDS